MISDINFVECLFRRKGMNARLALVCRWETAEIEPKDRVDILCNSRRSRSPREINSCAVRPLSTLWFNFYPGAFVCSRESRTSRTRSAIYESRVDSHGETGTTTVACKLRAAIAIAREIVPSHRSEGAEWWNPFHRPSTEWRGISSSEWARDGNWEFEFQPWPRVNTIDASALRREN